MKDVLTNEEIAYNWFDCFNTKDLDGLLELYAEDAKHFSPKLKQRRPETEGWISGKNELRKWWADAFHRLPTLHYIVQTLTSSEDRIVMEYLRTVEGENPMMIAEVLEIKEGKIQSSRVYHS